MRNKDISSWNPSYLYGNIIESVKNFSGAAQQSAKRHKTLFQTAQAADAAYHVVIPDDMLAQAHEIVRK
ncbi:MAG: hypothetical protein AABY45_10255 [Deltaproteobacteria bacterium]